MQLISTAKTTILSDFNDLEIKSVYQHANGENTDFQFYNNHRIFVEVNKKSGLEIMRIKEMQQQLNIQRVRKLTIDSVYCVACSKDSAEEMAVGLSNGQVKCYNYIKSEFTHKFSADSNRNSVLYLDYNASDEYIASVFENGMINIYGRRTKTKIDSINIDGNSTLARFHPTKRFQMAIASYKGAVTIFDVYTKRKLFHAGNAHAAQCRDLCTMTASPDTLISVGYDCCINIYDTRRKLKLSQLTYCHPLSTVAASECGNYFCVGNLKGELTTYDMRNTKVYLLSKKIHDCGVTRVAFVPLPADNSIVTSFQSPASQTMGDSITGKAADISAVHSAGGGTELRKSIASNLLGMPVTETGRRDSFCDFLDFQANRGQEKISPRFAPRRDSFDWEALSRKPDENRLSYFGGSSSIANNSTLPNNDSSLNMSDLKIPLRERGNTPLHTPPTQTASNLSQIAEEDKAHLHDNSVEPGGSDKENPQIDFDFVQRRSLPTSDRNCTTETPANLERTSMDGILKPTKKIKQKSIKENLTSTKTAEAVENSVTKSSESSVSTTSQFQKAIEEMHNEMNQRFKQLEGEMKFIAETNKWQMFTHNFNLWHQRSEDIEEIRDCLGALLQTDPFVHEFVRLKQENEALKSELQKILEK